MSIFNKNSSTTGAGGAGKSVHIPEHLPTSFPNMGMIPADVLSDCDKITLDLVKSLVPKTQSTKFHCGEYSTVSVVVAASDSQSFPFKAAICFYDSYNTRINFVITGVDSTTIDYAHNGDGSRRDTRVIEDIVNEIQASIISLIRVFDSKMSKATVEKLSIFFSGSTSVLMLSGPNGYVISGVLPATSGQANKDFPVLMRNPDFENTLPEWVLTNNIIADSAAGKIPTDGSYPPEVCDVMRSLQGYLQDNRHADIEDKLRRKYMFSPRGK